MGQVFKDGQTLTANDVNLFTQASDLAASTGAALVGSTDGTVQGDINARPTSASLAASGGAGLVGYSQGAPGSKTSGTTGSQLDNLSASGATVSRPTPAFLGQPYFDTTLGQPIWCSSLSPVVWVNAAGVSV